ncbi:unnamed protein product [Somion occarium]|uniref:Myosin-binding domain-containing protein n=1 Tax=Somion occarium TaxID=3059160 RepID=A0ABP1E384_9APHY
MAQPVFEDHPLEEYFRLDEDMPGGTTEFLVEEEPPSCLKPNSLAHKLSLLLSYAIHTFNTLLSCSTFSSHENAFAERFKYDVISSSLLSASIAAAPSSATRRSFTPDIPGRLSYTDISDHSRNSSITESSKQTSSDLSSYSWSSGIASMAVLALSVEYYFLALFLGGLAFYMAQTARSQASRADGINQTMDALNEVISAGNVWDSAVNEAMSIVEADERRPSIYGVQSPFSSLRIALQSSLLTTQNQCDNVRQLLSALTTPSQLAQLSEMYAPASPIRPSFLPLDGQLSRPLSDPVSIWRKRTSSLPAEATSNKRATWNGSYVSLAQASSIAATPKRKEKRRSDMSALFSPMLGSRLSSISAPASPQAQKKLADVKEEVDDDNEEFEDASPHLPELKDTECFGVAALDLHRKRKSAGLETLLTPPPSYTTQAPQLATRPTRSRGKLSLSSPTRFTLPHTSRHPLSVSALRLALQGALAAKRYACSHLLALRFEEEEEDSYWEDVRSLMALLTSTFSDASSRLMEALDEAEKQRIKDERPTAESSREASPELEERPAPKPLRTMAEMHSFAPMPSHLTRFAAHVDAISSALNDARSHLEECVASLRESQEPEASMTSPEESVTVQAYDRLRKEIGFALRECERGRERLLDIVSPASNPDQQNDDSDPPVPSTPPLVHTDSSEELSFSDSSQPPVVLSHGLGLEGVSQPLDDVTEHLLLSTSSRHLPPPGVEQVFEAESGQVGIFTRERSRLSREDRIRMAKAKRDSGNALVGSGSRSSLDGLGSEEQRPLEKWGPGGEVVQELKDVIWKVGEKRRKMIEQFPSVHQAASSPRFLDSPRTSSREFPLVVNDHSRTDVVEMSS